MSLSPKPKASIRTSQAGCLVKAFQLTPVWEEAVKNNRLPPGIDQNVVFKEIAHRLEDLEWPVRQHGFRVLCDIMPVLPANDLDQSMMENNLLRKLITNLGHPAPGIRKVAFETLQKYLRRTAHSEKMLENIIVYGIKENSLIIKDETVIPRESITIGTIRCLADILRPFIESETESLAKCQKSLGKTVEALASKMRNPYYRDECLLALRKLKQMAGKQKFFYAVQTSLEKNSLLNQANLFEDLNLASECGDRDNFYGKKTEKTAFDSREIVRPPPRPVENFKEISYIVSNESSEECTDGTDTDTYTKESVPNNCESEQDFSTDGFSSESSNASPSFLTIDDNLRESFVAREPSRKANSRIFEVEAEIRLPDDDDGIAMKPTKMAKKEGNGNCSEDVPPATIINEGKFQLEKKRSNENWDPTAKTLCDHEEITEEDVKTRTPRRVRFGGEIIKLRTPDSDTTDITITVQESEENWNNVIRTNEGEMAGINDERSPIESSTVSPPLEGYDAPNENWKFKETLKMEIFDSFDGAVKTDCARSELSSSGSQTEINDSIAENSDSNFWRWSDLNLVDDKTFKDIQNLNNWKVQYRALERLKSAVNKSNAVAEAAKLTKNPEKVRSLFQCLLCKIPENNNPQVVALALSTVTQLISILPKDILHSCVRVIVQGLCRHFGASENVNFQIESTVSLKQLFDAVEPSRIIDELISERCLFSKVSKLRESALTAIVYVAMTFPSNYFDANKILEKVMDSAGDVRCRVRHVALEAIAVLSQFCSAKTMADNIERVAEKLPQEAGTESKIRFASAIQTRLSRRLLPSISSEGLVLYSLRIPPSKKSKISGYAGYACGADVEWIVSGAGSLSTSSVKSEAQLSVAQRPRVATTGMPPSSQKPSSGQFFSNHGTIHDGPSESVDKKTGERQERQKDLGKSVQKTRSPNSAASGKNSVPEKTGADNFKESEKNFRAEDADVTWTSFSPAAVDEGESEGTGEKKCQNLWGESVGENVGHRGFEPFDPLYQLSAARSEDFGKFTFPDEKKKLIRSSDKNDTKNLGIPYEPSKRNTKDGGGSRGKSTKIPILRKSLRRSGSLRNISEGGRGYSKSLQPFPRKNHAGNGVPVLAPFLPSIPSVQRETPLSSGQNQTSSHIEVTNFNDDVKSQNSLNRSLAPITVKNSQESFLRSGEVDHPTCVASAPAAIGAPTRDHTPSTSSSNSTDYGTLSGSELKIRRLVNDRGIRNKRAFDAKPAEKKTISAQNKIGVAGKLFPENLKPFERPKEGLETCLNQLESQQWEVNMLGLNSLVRLLRHHPTAALGQLHSIILVLGRQIKNLRSQVSRAACQASAEMFLHLKRNVEPDLDELSGPLFHRSADTNRFIRSDCNDALDNMVDNVGPAKAVSAIVYKGATHQNATVKATAARLLLRLSEKVGHEKLFSLSREIRDKMLQTGANLLMEGKLETRAYAKQVFGIWSSNPSFSSLILEVIPQNVMRHISKTLLSLNS